MGRQIAIVMTEIDEEEFFDWLSSVVPLSVVPNCVSAGEAALLDRPQGALGAPGADWFFLWRTGIDPEPPRHPVGERMCIGPRVQAIEFTRTSIEPLRPRPGRIYVNTDEPRPDDFLQWYGEIATWIRHILKRDTSGRYWGRDALGRWPRFAAIAFRDDS